MHDSFASMYSLDPSESDKIVGLVEKHPSLYVMKPQREGGGNLLFDDAMVSALQSFTSEVA